MSLNARSIRALALTVLVVPAVGLPGAEGPAVGPELFIGDGIDPAVAVGPDGGFVVVWIGYPDGGVSGRLYDAAGVPSGDAFEISTASVIVELQPDVAMDPLGNFVVVWEAYELPDVSPGIFGRRFDPVGSPLADAFRIDLADASKEHRAAVDTHPSGGFVVTWTSGLATYDIRARRYDPSGAPLENEFVASEGGYADWSSVAAGDDGAFAVAWRGDEPGIEARRFDGSGAPIGPAFPVNESGDGAPPPSLAMAADGQFAISWSGALEPGGAYGGIGARRFAADATPLGGEFLVNSSTEGFQERSAVAAGPRGELVVVWDGPEPRGDGDGVFAQRFTPEGRAVGREFQVNTTTVGPQFEADIAISGTGDFVVVWEEPCYPVCARILGQRFAPTIFADGFETGDTAAWSTTVP